MTRLLGAKLRTRARLWRKASVWMVAVVARDMGWILAGLLGGLTRAGQQREALLHHHLIRQYLPKGQSMTKLTQAQ